jgi:hypothetical protein
MKQMAFPSFKFHMSLPGQHPQAPRTARIALDRRNSAELKATALYPNDSISSHMPSRASASKRDGNRWLD